jgi:predicted GIY-YIG superfamily endonuclease
MILNKKFTEYVAALHLLTEGLRNSVPLTPDQIACLNSPGLYSFSENGKVLYIGRTKNFRKRHKNHCDVKSGENTAAFAFLLARQETGNVKAAYSKVGGRKALMKDPAFNMAFQQAKAKIRRMEVRFVEVSDHNLQHLLELYASMELDSAHNKFETS